MVYLTKGMSPLQIEHPLRLQIGSGWNTSSDFKRFEFDTFKKMQEVMHLHFQ